LRAAESNGIDDGSSCTKGKTVATNNSNWLTSCSIVLLERLIDIQSQEIFCLLWNPEVHYFVRRSLPLVPVLN
jgi:hypothetical protein